MLCGVCNILCNAQHSTNPGWGKYEHQVDNVARCNKSGQSNNIKPETHLVYIHKYPKAAKNYNNWKSFIRTWLRPDSATFFIRLYNCSCVPWFVFHHFRTGCICDKETKIFHKKINLVVSVPCWIGNNILFTLIIKHESYLSVSSRNVRSTWKIQGPALLEVLFLRYVQKRLL